MTGIDLPDLLKNKEVLVLDILQHVHALGEDYLAPLVPAPAGIYIAGCLEPLFPDGVKFYERSQVGIEGCEIRSIEDVLGAKDDIVNAVGETMLALKDIRTKGKYLLDHPTVPVVGVKIGIGVVLGYLDSLNKNTHVNAAPFRAERWIKPEFLDMVAREDYNIAFEALLDQVMDFVHGDTWHIYFYRVKGTTLIIEKTIDWRIYRYYELTQPCQDVQED